MPNNYINDLSTKYGISRNNLEKDWSEAEKAVDKSKYGDNYYAVVTSIFKKMINSHYNLNENVFSNLNFKQFYLYEDTINHYEIEEMPTKELQRDNQEKYIQQNQ